MICDALRILCFFLKINNIFSAKQNKMKSRIRKDKLDR